MLLKQKKTHNNFSQRIQKFYEFQYRTGEYKGPKWFQGLKPFIKNREEEADKFLAPGENLLDVGCGEGWLVRKCSTKYKQITGIDIAENRIKRAKNIAKKERISNVNFMKVNIELQGLPFKDGEFENLVCISVLQYVFDPEYILAEFQRILQKKGILVIEVPNVAYLPERIKLLLGKLPGCTHATGWGGGVLHFFTKENLSRELKKSGFEIVKITGSGFLAPLRNWWPSLLCGNIIIKAVKK